MSARYEIRIYNTQGTLLAVFTNFTYLEFEHNINRFSTHKFDLDATELDVDGLFGVDYLVEFRRVDREFGIESYREYAGFHRTRQEWLTEGQQDKFSSYGRSFLDLINRRIIGYYAGSAKAGPADECIVEFVDQNAGPNATQDNDRLYPGVTSGLVITPATGNAPDWDGERSYVNLLDVIQEIGESHSVDFDVTWDGAVGFTFYTKYPRLGTDRSADNGVVDPVIFSTHFGNMVAPSFTHSRTEEVNTLFVLGAGQEDLRETLLVKTTRTDDSPWNQIESSVDDRMDDTDNALFAAGKAKLEELDAKESFVFEVLQTPGCAYGKHYFLGDLITATFKNHTRDLKIVGVRGVASDGKETLTFEFSDPLRAATELVIP